MALTAQALTKLETAKQHLIDKDALPPNAHDALLELLIEGYSAAIDRHTGRTLARATYTNEKYVGNGRQWLKLRHWPIVSVASVTVDGSALLSTDYDISADDGMLFRENGWTGGAIALGGLLDDPHPAGVRYNIQVTYTAGYVTPNQAAEPTPVRTLPFDLELAVVKLVTAEYKLRDKQGLGTHTQGDMSMVFDRLPKDIMSLLDKYTDVTR
jgi:hypothetical protein